VVRPVRYSEGSVFLRDLPADRGLLYSSSGCNLTVTFSSSAHREGVLLMFVKAPGLWDCALLFPEAVRPSHVEHFFVPSRACESVRAVFDQFAWRGSSWTFVSGAKQAAAGPFPSTGHLHKWLKFSTLTRLMVFTEVSLFPLNPGIRGSPLFSFVRCRERP